MEHLVPRNKHPVKFELKQDANPTRSRLYKVSNLHEEMLKKEARNLVLLGLLEIENDS